MCLHFPLFACTATDPPYCLLVPGPKVLGAVSQAGQLGCTQVGTLGKGWGGWCWGAFSRDWLEFEEEETWPEIRVGFPLEEWW